MYITLAQLILFTFYFIFVLSKYGAQKSISESWYVMKEKWMFSVVLCFGVGMLQLMHGSVLFFLAGASLCFVGAATDFRSRRTVRITHYIGAFSSIILSLIALWQYEVKWPIFIIFALCIGTWRINNRTWWLEIGVFYVIMLGLLEYYI